MLATIDETPHTRSLILDVPGWRGHRAGQHVDVRLTAEDGYRRRIDHAMLREVVWPPTERPLAFVCGPTTLVESVASALVELGHSPECVRTERFGPGGAV